MRKNKLIVLVTLVVTCILQVIKFLMSPETFYQNGFMVGLHNEYNHGYIFDDLALVLLPVFFTIFYTSGSTERLTHGYGKLMIIRSYSKTRLMLKNCLRNLVTLTAIALFQVVLFLFANPSLRPVEGGMLKSFFMYVLTLNALIMLQGLLELYISAHVVNVILFAYTAVSYYVVQVFWQGYVAKVSMFPCLMFGTQNRAIYSDSIYYIYLISIFVISLLILGVLIKCFKRADIF